MYISDGEFMMAMARNRDHREFQREYANLQRRHNAELKVQAARHNLEQIRMQRRLLGQQAEAGMRQVTERLIARLGDKITPEFALALRGKLEADLLAWNIEPMNAVPGALAAWRSHEAAYNAKFPPPTLDEIEGAKLADQAGVHLDQAGKKEIGALFATGAKAKTKAAREAAGDAIMDKLDPGWREQEKRVDASYAETLKARQAAYRGGEPVSPFHDSVYATTASLLKPSELLEMVVRNGGKYFTLIEKLQCRFLKKVPVWALPTPHEGKPLIPLKKSVT